MRRFNRELDVVSNIIEVNAATEKKNAWMKMHIPDDFAVALMKAMIFSVDNPERPTISDIKLCWLDSMGETASKNRKTLRELLQDDILDRYDNSEYWEIDEDGDDIGSSNFTRDILNRYDNIEYWDRDIVVNYFDESDFFTRDDIELALRLVSPEELISVFVEGRILDDS